MEKVAVIGSGTMGAGIAQICLQAGYQVVLNDVEATRLAEAEQTIGRFLRRAAQKGQFSLEFAEQIIANLSVTTDLAIAGQNADWVIEAIFEDLEIKTALFQKLNQICPPHTIFASNTSGLSITKIGKPAGRPSQTVGLHFFNPVPLMKLVEVIRGDDTDDSTLEKTLAFATKLGKTIVISQDKPNFIVNRINRAVYLEAQLLLQEGIPAQIIDQALVQGANFKMGPLQTSDLSGINVGLSVTENIFQETGEARYRPVPLVRQLVRAGHIGKRVGKGFYLYPTDSEQPIPRQPNLALPQVTPAQRICLIGGDEAWQSRLSQANLELTDTNEADLILIFANDSELPNLIKEQTIVVITDSLKSVSEYGCKYNLATKTIGLYCPLPTVQPNFYEVILGLETDLETAARLVSILEQTGCRYGVSHETPIGVGGITLRILSTLVNEAAFALQEKLTSMESVDLAMRLGMNYGFGPFEYADKIGIKKIVKILQSLQVATNDPRYEPAELLLEMLKTGKSSFY